MPDPYTQLLEWRRNEGAARGLAKLPHDFYPSTQAYLAETRKTYETELRENPSGRRGELARQTHQRASQIARDIIEARTTKVLSQAFQASVGGARDLPNALPEERSLFDTLLTALRGHRSSTAPYLEPVAPVAAPSAPPARSPAGAAERSDPPASSAPIPRAAPVRFVRILRDSRPLEVGKETLELRKDDVLSLPEETARLLIRGKVAEALEPDGRPPVA